MHGVNLTHFSRLKNKKRSPENFNYYEFVIIGAPLKDNTIIYIINIYIYIYIYIYLFVLRFVQNSFLIRLSSKTSGNRRIRAPGPNKNSSTRSGDHFALVKSKNEQV